MPMRRFLTQHHCLGYSSTEADGFLGRSRHCQPVKSWKTKMAWQCCFSQGIAGESAEPSAKLMPTWPSVRHRQLVPSVPKYHRPCVKKLKLIVCFIFLVSGHFCGEVWSYDRGLVPKTGWSWRTTVHARDSRHSRNGEQIKHLFLIIKK